MRKKITAGALAGIASGIVFGMMMQMMSAPTPDGGSMPMMGMVARVVGSTSLAAGWAYHPSTARKLECCSPSPLATG